MVDVVVVGSGPNGLVAAIELARAGLSVSVLEAKATIGGGTRTEELTRPGFRHDVCSAFHPLAAASPALAAMPLADHGLDWIVPDVQVAHPLADGTAAALWHSSDRTAQAMGGDSKSWRRMVAAVVDGWDTVGPHLLGPLLRHPPWPHVPAMARLTAPATWIARRFSPRNAALFIGVAAHSCQRLSAPASAGTGILLSGLAHRGGWPLARGGSAAITTALASYLQSLGGSIELSRPVASRDDLGDHKVAIFNTAPRILGNVYQLPRFMQRWVRRYRHGPGAFKVDYALSGAIPWKAEECRRAGTVHVGGDAGSIIEAEAAVAAGVNPERPFVLVGQQSLFDPSRAPDGAHTAWVYTHVPNGFRGNVLAQIESQIERFAPGFGDIVLQRHVMGTRDLEDHNPNYVGGDIGAGAMTLRQIVARPRFTTRPYSTSIPGVYLASAATPPGPGVHGMGGYHAAQAVLRDHCAGGA